MPEHRALVRGQTAEDAQRCRSGQQGRHLPLHDQWQFGEQASGIGGGGTRQQGSYQDFGKSRLQVLRVDCPDFLVVCLDAFVVFRLFDDGGARQQGRLPARGRALGQRLRPTQPITDLRRCVCGK